MYGKVGKTNVDVKSPFFRGWSTNRKYAFIKSCYKIARVFTDSVVNMWSVDYMDGLKRDYKTFEDLPNSLQTYVRYCRYTNHEKYIGNKITSYSMTDIYTFQQVARFTSFTK